MAFQEFTPMQYLMIDIANSYGVDGLDREDWSVRLDWFQRHENHLDRMVPDAKSPALMYAGIQAYKKALKGEAIGYPVSLDATASGIQFLAVLTNCRTSALQCNVVDSGHREDAYTNHYAVMNQRMGDVAKIERDVTKYGTMTAFYTSKQVPEEIFGEGTPLLECFYETIKELFPLAWELNEAMMDTWQSDKLSHDWIMPDNYHVKVKVMGKQKHMVNFDNTPQEVVVYKNMPQASGRSNGANMVHSVDAFAVREITARCMYDPEHINMLRMFVSDPNNKGGKSRKRSQDQKVMELWDLYKKSGYLSVRILGFLDPMNMGLVDINKIRSMLATLPSRPFQLLITHDCFRVLPTYGNDIRRQYNQVLSEMADSNMLQFIVSQIVGHPVTVNKTDSLGKDILETNYALS